MLDYDTPALTVAEATNYINAGGLTGWPALEADRASALLRGQRYLAREFNNRWGIVFTNSTAPDLVKFAVAEVALVEARSPGVLSRVVTPGEAKALVGVDSIRWALIPMPGGEEILRPRVTHVDAMLAPITWRGPTPTAFVV